MAKKYPKKWQKNIPKNGQKTAKNGKKITKNLDHIENRVHQNVLISAFNRAIKPYETSLKRPNRDGFNGKY